MSQALVLQPLVVLVPLVPPAVVAIFFLADVFALEQIRRRYHCYTRNAGSRADTVLLLILMFFLEDGTLDTAGPEGQELGKKRFIGVAKDLPGERRSPGFTWFVATRFGAIR